MRVVRLINRRLHYEYQPSASWVTVDTVLKAGEAGRRIWGREVDVALYGLCTTFGACIESHVEVGGVGDGAFVRLARGKLLPFKRGVVGSGSS